MSDLRFGAIAWDSEEYRQALELRRRELRLPLGLDFSAEDEASERDQTHYVAWIDDQIVGCVSTVSLGDGIVKVRQMAVRSSHQRKGIGMFLMKHVEAAMDQLNHRCVKLHARQSAAGFYEKLGYQVHGEPFIEVSIPHVVMSKRIRS